MKYQLTSPRAQTMMDYLPEYYGTSAIMGAIVDQQAAELDKLYQTLDEVLKQYFVQTATWGLDLWEMELGLPVRYQLPDNERRGFILSRIRGIGTATRSTVEQVAESFGNGSMDIIEDFQAYRIIVRFAEKTGIPSNIQDLQTALREVVPAHLDIQYEYNHLTWDNLESKHVTWDMIENLHLTWDQFQEYL